VQTTIFLDPSPRRREDIFAPETWAALTRLGSVKAFDDAASAEAAIDELAPEIDILIGQTGMSADRLARAGRLRAIINVETNFLQNIDYGQCFARGIPVLTPGAVFARPVAEMALGLSIDLARGITESDRLFRVGRELYGRVGNRGAFSLYGATVGIVGFGDLGRAFRALLVPFGCEVLVHDPWLPDIMIEEAGATACDLDELLRRSRLVVVCAASTSENARLFDARAFAAMPDGAAFVLMSRAAIVDFDSMLAEAASGRLRIATDVFPIEPAPADAPCRTTPGVLLSPHRAGALQGALHEIGRRTVEDIDLILRGAAPRACRRAEPETVLRLRGMPAAFTRS
jgi:phosphoglycerate dehydrogenase-like enzyme